jgi:tetratricopeptide (TPR) repeat protein
MAIEGPLRELGIHDVFQLLDLSRKTGMLRVSSELREDEGLVFFDNGKVVLASIRSLAMPTELALVQAGRITEADVIRARERQANGRAERDIVDLLVEIGAISHKELERQLRLHIESVIFELMSWHEGFFSFEERSRAEMPKDTRIAVSTESLLMEGARRIDEWSRIADIVPNAAVIPELSPVAAGNAEGTGDLGGPMLDLLPHEWQVLTMIDGERDLRGIAASLGRDEFETAKVAYGMATTGIIVLRHPMRTTAEHAIAGVDARLAAARTHTRAGEHQQAVDELRRALQEDPTMPAVHYTLAFAAARVGDLSAARTSWEHYLRLAPDSAQATRVRGALAALETLEHLLDEEAHG